jgi:hypothetical protein
MFILQPHLCPCMPDLLRAIFCFSLSFAFLHMLCDMELLLETGHNMTPHNLRPHLSSYQLPAWHRPLCRFCKGLGQGEARFSTPQPKKAKRQIKLGISSTSVAPEDFQDTSRRDEAQDAAARITRRVVLSSIGLHSSLLHLACFASSECETDKPASCGCQAPVVVVARLHCAPTP